MKYILSLAVILLTAVPNYSQEPVSQVSPCTLKISQSPAVRGIKLGMTLDQTLAMFPGSRDNDYVKSVITGPQLFPTFGVINLIIDPSSYGNKEHFAGINSFNFTFIDDRMVDYYVEYARPPWPQLDDFIGKVADAFQLPPASHWTTENSIHKKLACDGFRIQAVT